MLGERVNQEFNFTRLSARLALAAMLSTGLTAAVATPQAWGQPAQAASRADADIQSDVAYAISNSAALKGQAITAATVEGDVTISGHVRDAASKELAESLVYRVNGVRSVTNNLTIGDAAPASADAQAADPNASQQQDPNYDPAQQNLAPAGPPAAGDDQNQAQQQQDQQQPMPPPQAGQQQQYPSQQQQYPSQQPYPPQQQYGQQSYGQQQPNYAPQAPSGPVTVPSGTLLQVRTSEPLDATKVQPGQVFQATLAADIYQGNVLVIPRGAVITGRVVATKSNQGDLAGKQGLSLQLTSVNLGGQSYPLPTDTWNGQGPGKAGYTAGNTIGGAALGAIIGGIAGRGTGAAIGAGVGGAVGAGASAATTGPRMYLPAEAVVNFHLTAPVTVTPVSPQEAQRLASSTYPQQPQLRPRGPYPYGYYPPPPPPGYYYPYRYPAAYYPYYYYRY
ncbi:hypothetical protein ACPOL_6030 [Acidisarcina polymorpha]|uniref:BON domain-containing protein n=1 Tax=Acidisarcina polymorpha TaxID=2211140 RepID=A0A2Z5G9A7_9BACT|nr:BON domain-containing protein [Acidisarcina polymorpha]AXC15274.1 hypothetical protein ACPOL_6030 [Acidisarcina polymorpha]